MKSQGNFIWYENIYTVAYFIYYLKGKEVVVSFVLKFKQNIEWMKNWYVFIVLGKTFIGVRLTGIYNHLRTLLMPKLLVLKQLRYAFSKYTQPSTGKPLSRKCSGEITHRTYSQISSIYAL